MSSDGSSTVLFRRVPVSLRRGLIRRFARELQSGVAGGRVFDCVITSDTELRRLNREFRGHDAVTDVLAFPSGAAGRPARPSVPLGDIAVSVGRARTQARAFRHTVEQEIQILMLHGLLHLLGMDHENDAGPMARAEKRWRVRLGLPDGLIERARS